MQRLLAVVLAACAVTPAQAQQANAIPVCPGLTIVTMIPGSTAFGVSTAVLRSLERTGKAELRRIGRNAPECFRGGSR